MVQQNSNVTAVVLGTIQDGGLPHIGCVCPRCRAAFQDPARAAYAASLAVIDYRREQPAVWIIDATPDIKWQLAMLADELGPDLQRNGRLRQPDGLFLTHAHLGHIGGLPQFGPEAMAVRDMPLFGTPPLIRLLQETSLWRPVISRLLMRPVLPGETITLAPGLTITAVPVPHRDEWEVGTVAYRLDGPQKKLLYLPDIDGWDLWPEARENLAAVDVALVDASFFSPDELGGRAPVAHPLVPETLRRFADIPSQLFLTHINHTNPILDRDSAERREVLQSGVKIAYRGLKFSL